MLQPTSRCNVGVWFALIWATEDSGMNQNSKAHVWSSSFRLLVSGPLRIADAAVDRLVQVLVWDQCNDQTPPGITPDPP